MSDRERLTIAINTYISIGSKLKVRPIFGLHMINNKSMYDVIRIQK